MISGVFYTALSMTGYDVFKAFAYCWIEAATGMAALVFITKDMPKYAPEAVNATIVWVILCYVISGILLITK